MRFNALLLLVAGTLLVGEAFSQGRKFGGNRDEHGCLPSAGYTWSEIKNRCVRVWEAGVKLEPEAEKSLAAFVIFSEDGKSAELFMANSKKYPIRLKRTKDKTFSYRDYTIINSASVILSKNNKVIYRSL